MQEAKARRRAKRKKREDAAIQRMALSLGVDSPSAEHKEASVPRRPSREQIDAKAIESLAETLNIVSTSHAAIVLMCCPYPLPPAMRMP